MDKDEKQDIQVFNIRQVLEEIKKYRMIPKENILEFLLNEKKDDTAFFYYKNMLLQLVELDEHFCSILGKYDRNLQYGSKNLSPFLHKMLNSFGYGDTDDFKKIVKFARDITKLKKHNYEWSKLEKLTSQWRTSSFEKRDVSIKMTEKEQEQEEKKRCIEEIKSKIDSKGSSRGIKQFLEKRKLQKQKLQLEGELSTLEDESALLQEEYEEKSSKVEEQIKQIRHVFESIGMQELGEKIISDFPYVGSASNFFNRDYRSNF